MFKAMFLAGNVIALLLSPFSNVHYDITYPFTRTDSVAWSTAAFVEDLGEIGSNSTASGNSIVNDVKHEYKITYVVSINCNNACIIGFAHTTTGYNTSNTTGVIFYNERLQKKPSEMQAYLNISNIGSNSASHSFSSATADASLTITIQLASTTIDRTIIFPAVSEGTMIKSINDELSLWHEDWRLWEAYDAEQKTRQIEMWIFELSAYRQIPVSTMNNIYQDLNNGDPDAAYDKLNQALKDAVQTQTNESAIAETHDDNSRNAFNAAASDEMAITSAQETQFTNAISQIDTSNPIAGLTDLASSANWVKSRFNELTNNNAFGTLLGFSLLLGLALAIVGKIL